eukprot:6032090-Pleurochrysis_carterae.AAC.1
MFAGLTILHLWVKAEYVSAATTVDTQQRRRNYKQFLKLSTVSSTVPARAAITRAGIGSRHVEAASPVPRSDLDVIYLTFLQIMCYHCHFCAALGMKNGFTRHTKVVSGVDR